jgi:hypothetical protein
VRTIFRAILAAAGLAVLSAGHASAQNFVANGNFDANVNGWPADSSVTAAFDGTLGSPAPGSIRMTNSAAGGAQGLGVSQCIGAATAGKLYNWGGRMYFPGGQARTGNLQVGLRFYTGPSCTGNSLPSQPRLSTTIFDIWDVKTSNNSAAPAGTQSVLFLAFVSKAEAGGALVGNFDSLFFFPSDGIIPACVADTTTLCLNNGRFSLTAAWQTTSGAGAGTAILLTTDTGTFWFFCANNLEGIFKVVNGCAFNNFYWFFAGGLTNVKVTMRVFDTATGLAKIYENPLNTPFQPIQDTAGYPCP